MRVAINAQIDFASAGGVETNIHSLLRYFQTMDHGLDISVLTDPSHPIPSSMQGVSRFEFIKWRNGQLASGYWRQRPAMRGQRIRRLFGKHDYLFDLGIDLYRSARYGADRSNDIASNDQALRNHRVAAVHFPAPQLFRTSLPFLYEPWDLQYLHYPDFFPAEERAWRDRTYRLGCETSALVVTATHWTKNDIVEKFGIPPKKIAAIPRNSLITAIELDDHKRQELLEASNIPADFMFYPAMCFEHKNHIRLLQALSLLRDRDGLKLNLVLSGRIHKPFWPQVQSEIERLRLSDQVTVLGGVNEELLTALFMSASFLIFPSLFEGLGLPILEAFRHSLPVLAAAETCIPEVVGDAAILFDGCDVDAIAAAIANAVENPDQLSALIPAGHRRLDQFRWDRAGVAFAACYKQIMQEPLNDVERVALQESIGQKSDESKRNSQ